MKTRLLYFGIVLSVCAASACTNKKFVVKTIPVKPGLDLVWFHHSEITSNGPDYVEFNDTKDGREEVIFKAQLICQIQVNSDSIFILMQGNSILDQARDNTYHYKVIVDTTCKGPYLYK